MVNDNKGKWVAVGKDSDGKRKRIGGVDGDSHQSGGRKRKNRGVLQFFEDAADEDESDDGGFDEDDFREEEFSAQPKINNDLGEAQNLPFIPKEEEMNEEEFDKMMEERYKEGSAFIRYAEDDYENKRLVDRNYHMPSVKDPTMWKVKCMVGRERQSVFCLMQKFVDVQSLGTKLQTISAFAVDHIKGFIYIEAEKQYDVNEACKGLSGIYYSRLAPVPKNEVSHLLSAQIKRNDVSKGMWAYVKNGKYKGDLAQVVAVNNARKRATVKLIPRIDLQALAAKFGGGVTLKKASTAAPRLISPSELEEFRPLIQYRRDRETNMVFESLDGMMLKDGYLYKKVSIDSLSFWGVVPSEEELLKFQPPESNEYADLEWLSQLYGGRKKKQTITIDKGGDKGEGSSGSSLQNSFELYELVCFGRKDFGLIVSMEKDDHYKILKEGPEGPAVVSVELRTLKHGPFDMKFTALDQRTKIISVNDTVRISGGPSKGRQGIVRKIYRGILFLYDENETENGGYFCSKSQLCEKIKVDACDGKGGESGASGFEDHTSSPKSPLSPKKLWQARELDIDFKRGDKDGIFSIGQTLRIRVGPLKGYLCRVLAIRYSDVTVKLDSQQRILTVKSEHLAEVRGKSFATSTSEDPGPASFKPFDMLGTEGCSGGWMSGAGTSAEGDGWNAGVATGERSSWPSFPTSKTSHHTESNPSNPFGSSDIDPNKDEEDSAWGRTVTTNKIPSWGSAAAEGKNADCWNKAAIKNIDSDSGMSGSWCKAVVADGDHDSSLQSSEDNWSNAKGPADSSNVASDPWDKRKDTIGNSTSSWGVVTADKNKLDSWGKSEDTVEVEGSGWNQSKSWGKKDVDSCNKSTCSKAFESQGTVKGIQEDSWGKAAEKWSTKDDSSGSKLDWNKSAPATENPMVGWGNAAGECTQRKGESADKTSDQKKDCSGSQDQADGWNKSKAFGADGRPSWGEQDGGSSRSKQADQQRRQDGGWGKQDGESSWGKKDDGPPWSKQSDQQDNWGKPWEFHRSHGSGGRWERGGGQGGSDQSGRWEKEDPVDNWTSNSSDHEGRSKEEKQTFGWASNRDTLKYSQDKSCGWNKESAETDRESEHKDQRDGGSATGWGQSASWKGLNESTGNQDSNLDKKCNWNLGSGDGDRNNGPDWGKKGNWNCGSGGACESNDSIWGKKGNWNSGSSNASQESSWGKKGNWNAGSIDANEESSWGKKGNWNAGSIDANEESSWGKKGNWSTGSSNANQESSWGKKGNWNTGSSNANQESSSVKKGNWNSGSITNQESSWDKKGNWNGGSSNVNQESSWGKKGNLNSGSSDANWESCWGKKGNWNSGSSDANQESSWGKKGNWNSGSTIMNQEPSWDKRGNWKSGSSDANQESRWDKKGNWNSGSGNANQESSWGKKGNWNSESEDQAEPFNNRTSGGSFRGRGGGSDRGSYRVRGGFDRGGFGGRGRLDRGGYGGRGRSERGFGGRGSSDRGGFGGRGRGRRDQGGDWKSHDLGEYKSFDSNQGIKNNGGWSGSNDGAGSWNQGGSGGDKAQWQSWKSGSRGTSSSQAGGWSSQGGGWTQSTGAKGAEGSNDFAGSLNRGWGNQGSGWNSGTGSGNRGSNDSDSTKQVKGHNDQGGDWNKGSGGSSQAGGWDNEGSCWSRRGGSGKGSSNDSTTTKEVNRPNDQGGGWNRGAGGSDQDGVWGNQGSGWNSGTCSGNRGSDDSNTKKEVKGPDGDGGGWGREGLGESAEALGWVSQGRNGDQAKSWNQSNAADGCQAKDAGEGSGGGWGPTDDSRDETAGSSWGKRSDGSGKGGW